MQNLRKTLAGAFIAATLLGGTAVTPAFAGDNNGHDREYRQSYRHHDKYDDCDKKSYWRHGEKKYYWDCDDNGKYDSRYDHDWHNGDRHDRDRHNDNRHDHDRHNGDRHDRYNDRHDRDGKYDNGKYDYRNGGGKH